MISKRVRGTDDLHVRSDARTDIERDDARRAAERDARNEHDRRLAGESGAPDGADRSDTDRRNERR
ncbi:hypothetical protein [Cognatilysobacter bugurensis]|uniref:Uncharacterized protein n=1 Tax=Cognatilysobacter bugurensis TaxID=543356 RepID=A0A918SYV8_9GAMM|nr:hypothetical protein [Lysobacter bugurensis]GHA79640.1 hypothetical protein GCM10007067_16480 [Lysobacter bugurensis]